MSDMSPVDEIRAALSLLSRPESRLLVDAEVGAPLADWLEVEADLHADDPAAQGDAADVLCENFPHAVAVARAINGRRS